MLEANASVRVVDLASIVFQRDGARELDDLRVLVARLRRLLSERSIPAEVKTEPRAYRIVVDREHIDSGRFESLAERSADSDRSPEEVVGWLREACGLWRGEPLDDLDLPPHPSLTRLVELRSTVLARRFELELALGNHAEMLADLLAACRRDPLHERLWALGVVALYRAGRQADALRLHTEIRTTLRDELGLLPGTDLRAAEALVFRHSDSVSPQQPVSTAPLPVFNSSLIGRDLERAELMNLLALYRLVSVVGPGGVGKTWLAVDAVRQGLAEDKTKVAFCDLGSLESGDALLATIAIALGVRARPGLPLLDALVTELRNIPLLLILDTCEHVLDDVCLVVSGLLAGCHALRVVATSRVPLLVDGEQVYLLQPLNVRTDATTLFAARAMAGGVILDEDPETRRSVVRLCEFLDGLPLAIELAAARTRTLGPVELLAALDGHLELLANPSLGQLSRHRSLVASVEWSTRLLSPAANELLDRLAVFAGWFDLHAAAAVGTPDETASTRIVVLLDELVRASLVVVQRAGNTSRFRLLNTIAEVCETHLEGRAEHVDTRYRHAMHFAGVVEDLVVRLRGPDEVAAAAALDEQWPQIRAAVRFATANADADLVIRLLAGLGSEVIFRERSEVGDWVNTALNSIRPGGHPRGYELLATGSITDWVAGRFERGYERAQSAHRERSKWEGPLTVDLSQAALLHLGVRADPGAVEACRRAVAEFESTGDLFGAGRALVTAGVSLAYAGIPDEAIRALDRAEDLAARIGSQLIAAIASFARAVAVVDTDPEAAAGWARRSLHLATTINAPWVLGPATNYLTAALVRSSDPTEALSLITGSIDQAETRGSVQSLANTIRNLATLAARLDHHRDVARLVGWLATNPTSVPGSPGMRNAAEEVRSTLRSNLPVAEFLREDTIGASLTIPQVIAEARVSLAALT